MKLIEIDGVPLGAAQCNHCKLTPTREEAQEALRKAQEYRAGARFRCAGCGEPIKALSYDLVHNEDGWVAQEKEMEPAISLRIQPQNDREVHENNGLHLRCAKKALPYSNGTKDIFK